MEKAGSAPEGMDHCLEHNPEAVLGCLEKLAGELEPSSPCYEALRIAGKAILYAYSQHVRQEFAQFLKKQQLTPKQREHLRDMGLDIGNLEIGDSRS